MGTDRAGQVLGDRYRLRRLVASGGMGDVYEAEHIYIHKRVALKLLRSGMERDEAAVQRLHREAQATSAIGHDNIVEIVDFGVADDGAVFLAMEWLGGETLEQMLERDAVDLDDGLEIVHQVCKALAAAHAAGVVHRDLKPPNIFVLRGDDGALQVKVVDFGIAKLLFDDAGITQTGMVVGTPHYMAPEQGQGEVVDHRADVYAVGIILYEIAVGEVPFTSSEFFAVLHDHAITKPASPSQARPGRGITPVLEALIMKCLEKEPKDRFQDMVELQAAIDSVRGATARHAPRGASAERPRTAPRDSMAPPTKEEVAVPPPPPLVDDSLSFPARRSANKWVVAGAALLVAALAGTLTFFALGGADDDAAGTAAVRYDAAPPAPPDAAPPPTLTLRNEAPGAAIELRVTPDPIPANEPLLLDLTVHAGSRAVSDALAGGRVTARVQFLYDRDESVVASTTFVLGGDGAAIEPDRRALPEDGKYLVKVTLLDGGAPIVRAQFDVCVGASPCP